MSTVPAELASRGRDLLAPLGAEVERHRALAPVEAGPVEAAALVQRPAADVDAAAQRIDAHDLGAERRQRRAAEGAATKADSSTTRSPSRTASTTEG